MRALFSIFCLFSNLSGGGIAEDLEAAQQERTEQYHAVLAEMMRPTCSSRITTGTSGSTGRTRTGCLHRSILTSPASITAAAATSMQTAEQ
jgi:hypothetical protein